MDDFGQGMGFITVMIVVCAFVSFLTVVIYTTEIENDIANFGKTDFYNTVYTCEKVEP